MEKLIIDGSFRLREDPVDYITLGAGLAVTLGVRAGFVQPIFIYAPKRNVQVNLANPAGAFTVEAVQIGGVFSLNQPEYDESMAIIPIELARELFLYDTEVSASRYQIETGCFGKRGKRKNSSYIRRSICG